MEQEFISLGYKGLINMHVVDNGYAIPPHWATLPIPWLIPGAAARSSLGTPNERQAVTLDPNGNVNERYTLYNEGATYNLALTADYNTLRDKLLALAESHSLLRITLMSPIGGEELVLNSSVDINWISPL